MSAAHHAISSQKEKKNYRLCCQRHVLISRVAPAFFLSWSTVQQHAHENFALR